MNRGQQRAPPSAADQPPVLRSRRTLWTTSTRSTRIAWVASAPPRYTRGGGCKRVGTPERRLDMPFGGYCSFSNHLRQSRGDALNGIFCCVAKKILRKRAIACA